ncbi:MAG: NAD(P)-dependent dehydrogenase (short-subunit alcohol dehydrogenase family) [Enterobacterales bacterium]|jgi:NAD(P)-dependent dehydrogenase (short-subunit alcohol dehydrogenase family)
MKSIYFQTLLSIILIIISLNIQAEKPSDQKAILVTGASSGIGYNVTEMLASKGYFVYAGARKDKDMKALNAIKNVQAIRLDVNKWDDINSAVDTIKKAGRGLYGIVNNAGVAILEPLIEVEESELEFLFNVNVYGPYRITKAFAPLIIESKGRITTIGSIAGTLSGPFWGPYSMSKHAIEAYTDALAAEMAQFGVRISVIEPGNYDSKIIASFLQRRKDNKARYEKSQFKDAFDKLTAGYGADRSQFKSPEEVSESIMHALFSDKPKHRYMVVPNKGEATRTITQSMRKLIQQNQHQPLSFTREELIKIMDEMIVENQ